MIFAHGHPLGIKFGDENPTTNSPSLVLQRLAELCPELKSALESGQKIVIDLQSCNGGTSNYPDPKTKGKVTIYPTNLSQGLSLLSKNLTVKGFTGFALLNPETGNLVDVGTGSTPLRGGQNVWREGKLIDFIPEKDLIKKTTTTSGNTNEPSPTKSKTP